MGAAQRWNPAGEATWREAPGRLQGEAPGDQPAFRGLHFHAECSAARIEMGCIFWGQNQG